MAMANMNLIGVFVTKLWPVQALACGGGGGGDGGGATKTIISPKFSNFGYIIMVTLLWLYSRSLAAIASRRSNVINHFFFPRICNNIHVCGNSVNDKQINYS